MLIIRLLLILVLLGITYLVHEDGRKVERAVWLQEKTDLLESRALELDKATKLAARQNKDLAIHTIGVIDERDKALAALKDTITNQRTKSTGMWISAKACSDKSTMPGQTSSTSESSGADYIRLPEDVERSLEEAGQRAQETVIKHNACVAELSKLVTIAN